MNMTSPIALTGISLPDRVGALDDADRDDDLPDFYSDLGEDDQAEAPSDDPQVQKHGRTLSSLALLYLRHGDPSRAMVLSLAAMSMGDIRPASLLILAEAMLRAGDPGQALTVLQRFDQMDLGLVAPAPNQVEEAARQYITAKILHKQGDADGARDALAQAHALRAAVEPSEGRD